MDKIITSVKNKYVKTLRELANKSSDLFIVEGEKQVSEISESWIIDSIAVSESYMSILNKTIPDAIVLKDHVFSSISDTITPQGIIAVCQKRAKRPDISFTKHNGLYLVCDRVSDPGNLGTIIRNAHAFGCDCLFISSDSVDAYSPKVVRSSAGSLFHVPFIQDSGVEEYLKILKLNNIRIITTHLRVDKFITDVDFAQKTAIVIGNESRGVSEFATAYCDELARIPMPGGSESLNAAVASGIVLYEAARQRNYSA